MLKFTPPIFFVCLLFVACGLDPMPHPQDQSNTKSTGVTKQATVIVCLAGGAVGCTNKVTGTPCSTTGGLGRTAGGTCQLDLNANNWTCYCKPVYGGGTGGGTTTGGTTTGGTTGALP